MGALAEWWVLHTKTGVRMTLAQIAAVLDRVDVPKHPEPELCSGFNALVAAQERKLRALKRAQGS